MPTVEKIDSSPCCASFNLSGFYERQYDLPFSQTFARAVVAVSLALALAWLASELIPAHWTLDVATTQRLPLLLMAVTAAVMLRRAVTAYRSGTGVRAGQPRGARRVLILGTGARAHQVAQTLREQDPTIEIVGHVEGPAETDQQPRGLRLLAHQGRLLDTALAHQVAEVVVALTERRGGGTPLRELLDCKLQGVEVHDINTHFERSLGQVRLEHVSAHWLIFGEGFNQSRSRTLIKRCFDVLMSIVLLTGTLPIMLLAALAIRLESPGGVLYRQERVGLGGRTFWVNKLRSMRCDAEREGTPQWATTSDSRITRVGRFIRATRIDELPQLVNVLRGEMSLIGPRPERPYFVEQLTREIPFYAVRHSVKPGLSGWAQVRCDYGSTVDEAKIKLQYDLYYVKNHSLFLDILVALETVGVVLTGKGAR